MVPPTLAEGVATLEGSRSLVPCSLIVLVADRAAQHRGCVMVGGGGQEGGRGAEGRYVCERERD